MASPEVQDTHDDRYALEKKNRGISQLDFKKICHDALTSAETLAAADGFDLKKKIHGNSGGENFNGPLPWFPGKRWHIGGRTHHPRQLTYENHPPPIALDRVFDPPFALVSAETLAMGGA